MPNKLPCLLAGRNEQYSKSKQNILVIWSLNFGICLGFEIWNLGFDFTLCPLSYAY
jgi:hypothetical protein